jgi:hypothetical protein
MARASGWLAGVAVLLWLLATFLLAASPLLYFVGAPLSVAVDAGRRRSTPARSHLGTTGAIRRDVAWTLFRVGASVAWGWR